MQTTAEQLKSLQFIRGSDQIAKFRATKKLSSYKKRFNWRGMPSKIMKNNTIDTNVTLNKNPVPKCQANTLTYFVELGFARDEIKLAVSIYTRNPVHCVSKNSEFQNFEEELLASNLKTTISTFTQKYAYIQNKTDQFEQDFLTVLGIIRRDREILNQWIHSAQFLLEKLENSENIGDIKLWKGHVGISLHDKKFRVKKADLTEAKLFEVIRVFEVFKNQNSFRNKNSRKYLLDFLSKENLGILGKTLPLLIEKTKQIDKYCTNMVNELDDVEVLIRGWRVRIVGLDADFRRMLETLKSKNLTFEEDREKCSISEYKALNGGQSGKKDLQRFEFMMRDEF
ncbi:hypothetical protein Fcan01_22845 [Folsomia candida]|uniref:Uncharacterized protein n=1 Tax=Folsomia candida TaxID=158441 RepID=A0A226DB73_FOLCA|nr:hypothetical protein Fcan01_22845 [Folsomia candida]